jgi:hypothetical protein
MNNLYSKQNIIRVAKPNRMRWTKHVALIRGITNAYCFILLGRLEGHLGTLAWMREQE